MKTGKYILLGLFLFAICWNIAAQDVAVFPQLGHYYSVNSVAFSPDGKQIISGSSDRTIKLWDVATGREIRTFSGHTDLVRSAVFSPDGKQILSGSSDKTVKLWDVATEREIRTFSDNYVYSVAFSPDGGQILSGSYDKTIKLWDTATGREIRTFSGHSEGVSSVTFSPDGRQILSGSWDNTIKLWDVATGREIRTFSGHSEGVSSVTFSPDGRQILSGSWDDTIKLWDVATGREIRTFNGHSDYVSSVAFNPDGRQIISGSIDGTIKLWDTSTGREIRFFLSHSRAVISVAFSPDGKQIISDSSDRTIKLWDVATGREIRTFSGHTDFVRSAVFSPDGKQILSGSFDKTVKLWDVATGREIRTFSNNVHSVAFSPDGRQILYDSYDKTIKLWDTATGREIRTFSGHTDRVFSVAFSPDGRQILSGSDDGTIKLWDVSTERELRTFSGHGVVSSVAFSPDGRQILSGSDDGTIKLWDILTGREIVQFISFTDNEWIVLTSDGYYNASPNGDKYLNVRVGNNVYGIDQYRSTFYRPQIVEARLQGRPDPVQVTTTIQTAGVPPTVVIRNPENNAKLTTNQVELSVVIESRTPIKNIKFLVNGRLVRGDAVRGIRGVELEATGLRITENQNRLDFRVNLQLDPGNNRIEVIANNTHEGRDSVEVFSQQAAAANSLPNLWILSIGVNRYDSPLLDNLRFAVNDAREIINIFKAQEGRVFGKVNSLLIADGASVTPTRDNITDNLSYLRQAAPNDVVLLFIAGHGVNDDMGNFYFMPSDASFADNGTIRTSRAISHREIQGVLDAPGQKLVFIDACHSNNASRNRNFRPVDNSRLVRDLQVQSQSTVIFTSSRGDQPSHEMDNLRHGVFTYAVIQGMGGAANPDGSGTVSMLSLGAYVIRRVNEITNNSQSPTISIPEGFSDFRVARTK